MQDDQHEAPQQRVHVRRVAQRRPRAFQKPERRLRERGKPIDIYSSQSETHAGIEFPGQGVRSEAAWTVSAQPTAALDWIITCYRNVGSASAHVVAINILKYRRMQVLTWKASIQRRAAYSCGVTLAKRLAADGLLARPSPKELRRTLPTPPNPPFVLCMAASAARHWARVQPVFPTLQGS